MYPLSCGQLLDFTVLDEQSHRVYRLVVENRFQILNERETGSLNPIGCIFVAHQRTPYKALHGGFHGTQYLSWSRKPDHFKSTNSLVQLLTRYTQRTGIHRLQIVIARFF